VTNRIYPCLWFGGNAKAATEFYCSIFKNLKIKTDTPMVVIFELANEKILGLNGGPMFKINPSISFFAECVSTNETNEIWDKLMDGGKALMPIEKYPGSERYGWVQDKFGMTWQVMLSNKKDAERKITPSMLFTKNHFGKAEEAIHYYASVFDNSSIDGITHYAKENEHAGKVMFCMFNLNNYDMIAMDGPVVHEFSFNEAFSFVVDCDEQEEIDYYWNKFTLVAEKKADVVGAKISLTCGGKLFQLFWQR
jgi:predicted 3-demethylubiquinone-9 3-methyltransferase (glyoxalase superfamily)